MENTNTIDDAVHRIFLHLMRQSLEDRDLKERYRTDVSQSAPRREEMRDNILQNEPTYGKAQNSHEDMPRAIKRLWPSLRPGEWFKFKRR